MAASEYPFGHPIGEPAKTRWTNRYFENPVDLCEFLDRIRPQSLEAKVVYTAREFIVFYLEEYGR